MESTHDSGKVKVGIKVVKLVESLIFIFFLPRITRFCTIIAKKFLRDDPQKPLLLHIYNTSTMSYVCFVERGLHLYKKREDCSCTRKQCPLLKINLYVNNCMESRFKLYFFVFSPYPLVFFFVFFFFVFAFQNFRKVGPP